MRLLSKLSNIRKMFSAPDIAIDLGTANTRVFARDLGMVADTPTVVKLARQKSRCDSDSEFPADDSAKDGEFIAPLAGGVVTNMPAAAGLLSRLLQKTRRFDLARQRVLICAPSDVLPHERAALFSALRRAGAASVVIVPEPLAAAIGAGLDVSSGYAQMLVDIGDGVTDIAVVRGGALIHTVATRTAGGDLRRAIQKLIDERYRVSLPENQAEMFVQKLAAFNAYSVPDSMRANGFDERRRTVSITIESSEVSEAIRPIVNTIVETVRRALKQTTLDEYVEIIESGLTLTGGVAQMPGLAEFIAAETNLEVKTAPAPLFSVINGASRMLETAGATDLWLS